MDARGQGLLLAAVITLSLAFEKVLRGRKTDRQLLFMLFSANLGTWYLFSFLAHTFGDPLWQRLSLIAAVLLPQGGLRFFQAFFGTRLTRGSRTARVSLGLAVLGAGLALSPLHDNIVVRAFVLAQTAGLLYVATYQLHRRSRAVESRVEATRIGYIVFGGTVAITFSVLDFLPALGIPFPPMGSFLTLIFVYLLSQSLRYHRLLDIYELAGRLAVLLLMGMALATIFSVLVYWSELSGGFFLNAVVAALVILILFEPLRARVEEKIHDFFLRERRELEREIAVTRASLWHAFDIEQIGRTVMAGLEATRRVTHAALYVLSNDGQYYERVSSLGPPPRALLDVATVRPVLVRLEREDVVAAERLRRERDERGEEGKEGPAAELLLEVLEQMKADVLLPISSDEVALGLLALRDERLPEAYTPDDIQLLEQLATQVGVAVQNSQYYAKMKERDRLAALGEMAAGLAHEIRNPLGAIKGAAQMLGDDRPAEEHEDGEFLDVITEETNRLDRVVSTFLDYARPYTGDPEPLDVNDVVTRTIQILDAGWDHQIEVVLQLNQELPLVRADRERLHQVFINLANNAVQAMEGAGTLTVTTAEPGAVRRSRGRSRVEVRFGDSGPGIPETNLEKIFIPFFTTKARGTGLGLPICQRIVQNMGGSIEVESRLGHGSVFTVSLPALGEDEAEAVITSTGPIGIRSLSPRSAEARPQPSASSRGSASAPPSGAPGAASASPSDSGSGASAEASSEGEPAAGPAGQSSARK